MAYTEALGVGGLVPNTTGVLGVETLSAAAAVHGEYLVMRPMVIRRIGFYVTTLVAADTTAPVVALKKRTAAGVTAGQVTLGTLTIPEGAAVGQVYYKDISPVDLEAGHALALEHTVQAADSGSAAGAGFYCFIADHDPEDAREMASMVASA